MGDLRGNIPGNLYEVYRISVLHRVLYIFIDMLNEVHAIITQWDGTV